MLQCALQSPVKQRGHQCSEFGDGCYSQGSPGSGMMEALTGNTSGNMSGNVQKPMPRTGNGDAPLLTALLVLLAWLLGAAGLLLRQRTANA